MAEWLKAHDSKSCGQKCLGGSNPLASAKNADGGACSPVGILKEPWSESSLLLLLLVLGF